MSRRKAPATAEEQGRRYAERGVDRQGLRLRIDRELASRLREAAAVRRVSMNALAEALLADRLVTAIAGLGADLDLPQPTGRLRPPTSPVHPPKRATQT